jgi:hypothetical protein
MPGRLIYRFRSSSIPGASGQVSFVANPPLDVLVERGFTPVPAQRRAFNA